MDMQQDSLDFALAGGLQGVNRGMRFVIVGGKEQGRVWKTTLGIISASPEKPVLFLFS
jgi:hypothetical protein